MDTLFTELFGNSARSRVLQELLTLETLDAPISGIADLAEVTPQIVYPIIKSLEAKNMVINTRKVGNAQLYKLNLNHPAIKHMQHMFNQLLIPQK